MEELFRVGDAPFFSQPANEQQWLIGKKKSKKDREEEEEEGKEKFNIEHKLRK